MFFKRPALLFLLFFALTACTTQPEPTTPEYPQIRPVEFGGGLILPGGEVLNNQDFHYLFRKANYILLGEAHTNITDHMSQAVILEKMARQRLNPVVALEMLDITQQPVLDKFNSGELNVDELEQELNWARKVGYPFDLFRPIFEVAAKYKVPAYTLNIPREAVREARLKGFEGMSQQNLQYVPKNYIPATEAHQIKLRALFEQHLSRPDMEMMQNKKQADTANKATIDPSVKKLEERQIINSYIRAQSLWDSAMAERAMNLNAEYNRPVVIIVGQGHVEYGFGIAHRIRTLQPESRTVCVMPWRYSLEQAPVNNNESVLLTSAEQTVNYPAPDLADVYYYSPENPVGRSAHGFVTSQSVYNKRIQISVLTVIKESPAEKAGLLAGDIILQAGGRKINNSTELYTYIAQAAAYGTHVKLTIARNSEKIEIILPKI